MNKLSQYHGFSFQYLASCTLIHTIRGKIMYSLSKEGLTLQNEPMFIRWNKTSVGNAGVGQDRVLINYNRKTLSSKSKQIHQSKVIKEHGQHFSSLCKGLSWNNTNKKKPWQVGKGSLSKSTPKCMTLQRWKEEKAPSFRHGGSPHKPLKLNASR